MSQFGLPDSNDNALEEGNKLTSISNRDQKRAHLRINERHPDSVNISPSGTGRAAFTFSILVIVVNI